MATQRIVLNLNRQTLNRLDELVAAGDFADRSEAVTTALRQMFARIERHRFATECAKLDQAEEQALAQEGLVCFADDETY